MSTRSVAVMVFLVVLAACGGDADGGGSSTTAGVTYAVSGSVHSGPTCPVVLDPPDPGCADRPVLGALLIVRNVAGAEVAQVRSGADGSFSVSLPPGTYTLVPQPVEGLMGTAAELEVIVIDGAVTGLDVAYDTGIR
ncbi:MAG: carboxypeptidase regulatory-like domain-containing protein [Acidimicrobiia bacterium]|nr:carboxypeptidase regulatory-like domain-containing protein [Acidimicrobiia bacterium]